MYQYKHTSALDSATEPIHHHFTSCVACLHRPQLTARWFSPVNTAQKAGHQLSQGCHSGVIFDVCDCGQIASRNLGALRQIGLGPSPLFLPSTPSPIPPCPLAPFFPSLRKAENVFENLYSPSKHGRTVNKSAQSNLGRGPRRRAVAHVRRKVPIGYNGAPQIRPQNTPSRGPISKPHYQPHLRTRPTYDAKRHPNPICNFSTMHWTDRPTSAGKFDAYRPLRSESDAA